jgi:hypothetical protein
MKVTIVYNRKSGKIVHAHRASGEPKDVLRLVHPSHDRSQLETMEIDAGEMQTDKAYRVNPQTKKLEPSKAGVSSSADGTPVQGLGPHKSSHR